MAETLEEYKKRIASTGGKANIAKYGAGRMKKISKKGVETRLRNLKKMKKSNRLHRLLFE